MMWFYYYSGQQINYAFLIVSMFETLGSRDSQVLKYLKKLLLWHTPMILALREQDHRWDHQSGAGLQNKFQNSLIKMRLCHQKQTKTKSTHPSTSIKILFETRFILDHFPSIYLFIYF